MLFCCSCLYQINIAATPMNGHMREFFGEKVCTRCVLCACCTTYARLCVCEGISVLFSSAACIVWKINREPRVLSCIADELKMALKTGYLVNSCFVLNLIL